MALKTKVLTCFPNDPMIMNQVHNLQVPCSQEPHIQVTVHLSVWSSMDTEKPLYLQKPAESSSSLHTLSLHDKTRELVPPIHIHHLCFYLLLITQHCYCLWFQNYQDFNPLLQGTTDTLISVSCILILRYVLQQPHNISSAASHNKDLHSAVILNFSQL